MIVLKQVSFINYHCIIHQEHLCATTLRFDAVMKVANDVTFIQANELNHGQFQNFLTAKCEADHGDVIYYCGVRWLNRVKALKRTAN